MKHIMHIHNWGSQAYNFDGACDQGFPNRYMQLQAMELDPIEFQDERSYFL